MFPPTHRIYRSIRPRNRFIIGNKRRGLQAVSAICIFLIFIIYGLETIYTTYDQYHFESQNGESQKRRLSKIDNVKEWVSWTDDENVIASNAIRKWTTSNPVGQYFETKDNLGTKWWMLLDESIHKYQRCPVTNIPTEAILVFGVPPPEEVFHPAPEVEVKPVDTIPVVPEWKYYEDQHDEIQREAINTWMTSAKDFRSGPRYFETTNPPQWWMKVDSISYETGTTYQRIPKKNVPGDAIKLDPNSQPEAAQIHPDQVTVEQHSEVPSTATEQKDADLFRKTMTLHKKLK